MTLRRSTRVKKQIFQNLCEDYHTDSEEEDEFKSKFIVGIENTTTSGTKILLGSNNCSTKGRLIDSSEGYAFRKWKEEEMEEELEEMFLNLEISNTKQKYITNEGYESEYDYSENEDTEDEDTEDEDSDDDDSDVEDSEDEDSDYKKIDLYNEYSLNIKKWFQVFILLECIVVI